MHMKLTGNLKEQVGKAKTKEEAKGIIAEAGMELTEDELDQVSGGKETIVLDDEMVVNGWMD